MKKLFLLYAFVIAAVSAAPLEAMNNKRDRADNETEEDNRRVAAKTKQTSILKYVRPVNHPGIPTPNLAALAAPNNARGPIPPAPVRNGVLPAGTWRERQPNPQDEILRRLHE